MGGSPKRGGPNGSGALMSRGRVILVAVLALQLVLVVCLMKAPRLIWSSTSEGVDDSPVLDEAAPAVARGSWLWRRFVISTTAPNCTDENGRVVTEVVKGSSIKCSDRSSLLRVKWIEPKREVTSPLVTAEVASGPVLRKVNTTTVFRNSHGDNAGLREGRSRLRGAGASTNARSGSSVMGDLRQRRVQVGRDLPAAEDPAMASDSEAARETKSASWRLRRDFATNIRSSLDRDSRRFRGRTVGYGDERQRSGSREDLQAREAHKTSASVESVQVSNVSASIAPVARIAANMSGSIAPVGRIGANVSDSIAPGARIRSNVSTTIAPVAANESDSVAPVARIREPALVWDDEQPDEEEPEEDEPEEADTDVAMAGLEVSFGGRRGPLPSFNTSRSTTGSEISPSNTGMEISPRNTSLEISPRNSSLEISPRNTSLEISPRNSSLEISPRNTSLEISPRNTSLVEIMTGNSSLEVSPHGLTRNTSLGISTRNSSLEFSSTNTSLAEISMRNISSEVSPYEPTRNTSSEVSPYESTRNTSSEVPPYEPTRSMSSETSTRNMSSETSARNTSLNQTSESLLRNSSSSEELEEASPLTAPSAAHNATLQNATDAIANSNGTCSQGLIYVYKLPKKFNIELLQNCSQLLAWGDRCQELSNSGFGPALGASPLQKQMNASSGPWYGTDQFNGEVIFHNRILSHPCRTRDPELAKAFYIPYYGGLDVARFLFDVTDKKFTSTDRDKLGKELMAWLSRSPYWKRHQGLDHFLLLGRITWDFRRKGSHGWGSGLFQMPEMANVTKLALERSPYDDSEMAIPYPTAFHPRNDEEVEEWQKELRTKRRDLLFSFAGGKRKAFQNDFRVTLFEQCEKAESCAVLDCSQRQCVDDSLAATKLFVRSTFCLQPRGDSFTRRSIFDALIAGCIPVFFWTKSAYLQYNWHFPADHRSYSVFIPKQDVQGGVQIEDVLSRIPPAKVEQMRETVIGMIPRLVYAQAQGLVTFRDAFDTTIDHVMANFELRLRRNDTQVIAQAVAAPAMSPKLEVAARA